MATHLPWFACLLATLMVVGAMPGSSLSIDVRHIPDSPPAGGPSCAHVKDDTGTGGTHVRCYYNCGAPALLVIGVESSDAQAGTYGNTDCGGAEASCISSSSICAAKSETLTEFPEESAACNGHSDEFWDSPTKVFCIATSGEVNPREFVCEQADICPKKNLWEPVSNLCLGAGASQAELAALLPFSAVLPGNSILSLVVAEFSGSSVTQLIYNPGSCVFDRAES